MRLVTVALLSASFILCTSTQDKTPKKKTSAAPVITVDYLLYKPKSENIKWESQFNSSLAKVHEHARQWLRGQTISVKLQTRNILKVDKDMSSKLERLKKERNGRLVDPFEALKIVKEKAEEMSNSPDILCLVTQKPLTVYIDGFGLYYRLCKDVVPLLLTYKAKNDQAMGDELGLLIKDTLNITNLLTWYNLTRDEKKRRFEGCEIQRKTATVV